MTLTAAERDSDGASSAPSHVVIDGTRERIRVRALDSGGRVLEDRLLPAVQLPTLVEGWEPFSPRWVWDTAARYPGLLAAGVRVERCHDLRLARGILRRAAATAERFAAIPVDGWDDLPAEQRTAPAALFGLEPEAAPADALTEFERQNAAVEAAPRPGALRLLLAAESAGALAAAEMWHAGLPWRADVHERILEQRLGPRVGDGVRPAVLERLLAEIREALTAPALNPDSPVELVKALRAAGLVVESTRSRELAALEHPAIPPLLEYKKLARLASANGWHWLDRWVEQGRFRPDYVVGGVVTGRWATRNGGAMQLPKQIRAAVTADAGWRLVVADAAQLEPRVLAGMAQDRSMAKAGHGRDLYDGIVATGAVADRTAAKYGMLGALYGATQGTGGRLVPRLAQRFPQSLGLVERAARIGEQGATVSTLLGRTSPPPSEQWRAAQRAATDLDADPVALRRARSLAREQGRFTRNFVVQGTAAEWALCWMAELRKRLWELGSGALHERPHLVYFLHDEVLVHTPEGVAEQAAQAVREAAVTAGRLLFGGFPIDFPLDVAVVDSYADA
ncbi:bifunctional 3'-5' exonuclease/DNA polymerase [Amnibacterium sp.]|uniref:bifunctional 3'-5' exonuclease/DNA polymerase n=1 Tax=Amnibacterium sp. TaxID=1872496 RepID=UPI0026392F4D|nr:bifunctional 3'-5' exonuclease/DNA polymerase [Amnibacterium sp.]MCU1471987.1 bifunctional 3-5 exonuclease/DNA polymerase [Amnibacterium sp.]